MRLSRGVVLLLALFSSACASRTPRSITLPLPPESTIPIEASTARPEAVAAAATAATAASTQTPPAEAPYDTVQARPFDTGRMWAFDFPPLDYFQRTYDFRPTSEWLERVRLSALRFATGCSASFVSPEGLVMTNHHCAVPTLEAVQQAEEELLTQGFYASTLAAERRVPELFVEQLVSFEDVTRQMQEAQQGAGTEAERASRVQALRDRLEQTDETTRLRYQVVEFYNGGRYARYGYRRYDDVRLVFVPEQQIAFFGGDPDNFNYPRYALDGAFFRVYDEAGRPLGTPHYLPWSERGAEEGEPVFAIGHPGATQRQATVSQLEYVRDVQQPAQLAILQARRQALLDIARRDPLRGQALRDNLFSIENSIKAIQGRLKGAQDPALFARKIDFERDFQAAVEQNEALRDRYAPLWRQLAQIIDERRRLAPGMLYNAYLSTGPLGEALALLRALQGNAQARTQALARDERSALERQTELAYLLHAAERAVPNDSLLRLVLAGRDPAAAAEEIVGSYTLDPAARAQLLEAGRAAVEASPDPVLGLARRILPVLTARQQALAALAARETELRNQLGRAFYEVYGTQVPPDATFTLRLADGVVRGYEANGWLYPPHTTFFGLYERARSFRERPPFNLPARWQRPPAALDLHTPFNLVSTNDIIGGSSGSPLINRNAEVVGLVFDGNLESLPGSFIFDEMRNRTISVHSAGLLEALADVYGARRLVDEIRRARTPPSAGVSRQD